MTIGILYLSIGSGHKMAAKAIQDALLKVGGSPVLLRDPMLDLVPKFNLLAAISQGFFSRWAVKYYQNAWRSGNSPLVYFASRSKILLDAVDAYLCENQIDTVVCTHVFPLLVTRNLNRLRNRRYRIFGVTTDFGLHGLWPRDGIRGMFVPTPQCFAEMKARGFDEKRLFVSGIPVREEFAGYQSTPPQEIRREIVRLLFIGGGENNGAYMKASQRFLKNLMDQLTRNNIGFVIDFIAGTNTRLYQEINNLRRSHDGLINLYGYVTDIARFMHNSDLLLSKPGGLIVAETLASGLPILILKHGPGQERANADFLVREGIGVQGNTEDEIVRFLLECKGNPQILVDMKKNALRFGKPNAAADIAQIILGDA
jgi:processive 1,2-diacylglycerol beta-glucosyltransferase